MRFLLVLRRCFSFISRRSSSWLTTRFPAAGRAEAEDAIFAPRPPRRARLPPRRCAMTSLPPRGEDRRKLLSVGPGAGFHIRISVPAVGAGPVVPQPLGHGCHKDLKRQGGGGSGPGGLGGQYMRCPRAAGCAEDQLGSQGHHENVRRRLERRLGRRGCVGCHCGHTLVGLGLPSFSFLPRGHV